MSQKQIFLTGATGFVGSFTARAFLDHGCRVSVLVRPGSNTWRIDDVLKDLTIVSGDLSSSACIESHFQCLPPDAIVHLAWHGVTNDVRNDLSQLCNIPMVSRLLGTGIRHGCRAWVGTGSQAEYGPHPGVISETIEASPQTVYGVTKLAACYLAARICQERQVRFGWMRLFSCYGPMNNRSCMLPYLTQKLLDGEIPALTRGEQLWDYVYVEDVAEAIVSLTLHPSADGVFNVGSGHAYPLRRVIETVRDLIDPALPLGLGELPYRPDQIMHLEADISRLCSATGWFPEVSLDEGLRRSLQWQRNAEAGC